MNQRHLSNDINSCRINSYNQIKKYENSSYTKNKNLLDFWDKKERKSQQKLEKIRQELYDKKYSELRKTPKINLKSKKIVSKILNNKENNKNNVNPILLKSFLINKTSLTDCDFYSNKKKKNANIRIHSLRKNINSNNENNIKPIIQEKQKNIYLRDNNIKVNPTKEKVHNIFNSKVDIKPYKKSSNNYFYYKNLSVGNQIQSYEDNNNKIHSDIIYNPYKQRKNNINKDNNSKSNGTKLINKESKNFSNNIDFKTEKDTNNNIQNKSLHSTEEIKSNNLNESNKISKIYELNSRNKKKEKYCKSNSIDTLKRRNEDLNQFILFTNNLFGNDNNKNQEKQKMKNEIKEVKNKEIENKNEKKSKNEVIKENKPEEKMINYFPKSITKEMILSNNFVINDIYNDNIPNKFK